MVESPDAYFVTVAGDDEDWLVRFERSEGVDAGGWADNMVRTYNGRLAAARDGEPAPAPASPRPAGRPDQAVGG